MKIKELEYSAENLNCIDRLVVFLFLKSRYNLIFMCYLYVKAHSYGNYILYNDYNFPNPFNQIYIIFSMDSNGNISKIKNC